VTDVLLSNKVNYWTGQECRDFEREFATFSDSEYAIALANGTVALDLILHELGIGAGDEVVVTDKTRAVICVHLAGWPCDMDPIMDLVGKHDLFVIEDCAQAHGARYKGRSVGSVGHAGAWSFCQDKIMTTDDAWPGLQTNGPWAVEGNTEALLDRLMDFDGVIVVGNPAKVFEPRN
jgi:dTDP-4-amino-4,6-dideoxygalactose transaminase